MWKKKILCRRISFAPARSFFHFERDIVQSEARKLSRTPVGLRPSVQYGFQVEIVRRQPEVQAVLFPHYSRFLFIVLDRLPFLPVLLFVLVVHPTVGQKKKKEWVKKKIKNGNDHYFHQLLLYIAFLIGLIKGSNRHIRLGNKMHYFHTDKFWIAHNKMLYDNFDVELPKLIKLLKLTYDTVDTIDNVDHLSLVPKCIYYYVFSFISLTLFAISSNRNRNCQSENRKS